MANRDNDHLDRAQEETSPRIEEQIIGLLDGDLQETALRFASYLAANELTPRQWFGPHYWRIPYGKDYLCGIVVDKDKWRFWFFSGDYSGQFDAGFIRTVQDSVRPCVSCVDDCPKAKGTTIFGKESANACFQFPVQFENPDDSTLECIKGLIEYWKEVAPHSDSWHAH